MKVESNFEFHVFVYSSKVCCCDAYDQCSSKAILTVAYQKIKVLLYSLEITHLRAWTTQLKKKCRSDGESLATLFVNRLGN